MNIKSLLLGSAAALAVVSGAQAADAVVAAEPEPMEYVKVCDAYGTGFFYIPGTETCLKIGGEVRYEKNFEKLSGSSTSYWHHSRVRINFEAKNDSEWGTVYSWVRLQGDQSNNSSSDMKFYYYFGIGGLELGNYDGGPWVRAFGYGGMTDWGGDYGYVDSRQYISYTANFGSASAWISLDNDANENGLAGVDEHKYVPDVSAGLTGTFGDYTAYAGLGYDESMDSIAVKAKVSGQVGMFGFAALALYSDSASNTYFNYDGFSAIVGVSAKVTDSITLAKDFQYWDNGDWAIIGDVAWSVAPGFSVLLEGYYKDLDAGGNYKAGMLRFQRSF
jgi:hypothetical protein